jgi:hypothetical protein
MGTICCPPPDTDDRKFFFTKLVFFMIVFQCAFPCTGVQKKVILGLKNGSEIQDLLAFSLQSFLVIAKLNTSLNG